MIRIAATSLLVAVTSTTLPSQTIPGVRFTVDTAETPAPATGLFSMLGGRVEFGAGRGRIDVSTMAVRQTRSINDVTIASPSARPGDYYLFDTTGYAIVRPSTRTFSLVSFASSTYRHGNVREPWDDFFEFGPVRREDISPTDTLRLSQHGPFGVRWHLDRPIAGLPAQILARGRALVVDAPRGEAGVVRWMAVTPALASLRDSIVPLDSDLQLTAVIVLPPQSKSSAETNLILLHPMIDIKVAEIDAARLVLPPGYRETATSRREPAAPSDAANHWRTLPSRERRRSSPR